ncbi:MAG: RDD family protein [Patescibacteria group bacterium]
MKNVKQDELSQIKPAGAWARFWASVIDALIIGIPSLLLYFFLLTPLSNL